MHVRGAASVNQARKYSVASIHSVRPSAIIQIPQTKAHPSSLNESVDVEVTDGVLFLEFETVVSRYYFGMNLPTYPPLAGPAKRLHLPTYPTSLVSG